ncbi:hypothetical protein ABW19_dt0209754 [Dactylella cylindrospora]|nr:hypothetical protein ABW19_dt0209754 [Dactylella cylindrospora]
MSTPAGSLRLRQRPSLTESLNAANNNVTGLKSPSLSKRASVNSSLRSISGSLTGSQRHRLRENRAEALFDQITPFTTIRLMMSRAASDAPNAPAPQHLYKKVMDYFGTGEEEIAGVLKQQKEAQIKKWQENQPTMAAEAEGVVPILGPVGLMSGISSGISSGVGSGVSTPPSEILASAIGRPSQLSNSELMIYINTMLGKLPRGAPEGMEDWGIEELANMEKDGFSIYDLMDEDKIGYVSDYGVCTDGSSVGGADVKKVKEEGKEKGKKVGEGEGGCETREKGTDRILAEETTKKLKIREEEDDDYDMAD